MEMEKALISATENMVEISVPFTKFDKANRKVSGWATIDNIDQSGDVLTAEASRQAFESFRGNIREQHDRNKAVGKMVSFQQKDFYDQTTDSMYSGIYVTAYVSKGAQDTWEKVMDGTLSGFSVKGSIIKEHSEYVPDEERTIRFIDSYSLEELSLVDSPCNQLCNVFSIEKTVNGVSINVNEKMQIDVENVFWCDVDSVAIISKDDSTNCTQCEAPMKNAGWIERVAGESKIEKIKEILAASGFAKSTNDLQETKGGSEQMDTENEKVEPLEEVDNTKEVEGADAVDKKDAEETPVVTDEPDLQGIAKALDEIKLSLSKVGQDRDLALNEIRETVQGVEKSVDDKLTGLLKNHNALAEDFKNFKSGLGDVEKRLSQFESSTGIKKSVDVESENSFEKGTGSGKTETLWSNAFLPNQFD